MLSTAPAGGGLAGEMTTGWNPGSGWVNVLDRSIASNQLNLSDRFWSNCSLLSVEGFATLVGDFFKDLPLSFTDDQVFLSFALMLLD